MTASKSLIFRLNPISPLKIDLAAGEVWSRRIVPGDRVICDRGIVWLTHFHDSQDYLLHSQESFDATASGKVVVQALAEAAIEVR